MAALNRAGHIQRQQKDVGTGCALPALLKNDQFPPQCTCQQTDAVTLTATEGIGNCCPAPYPLRRSVAEQ
ncbi:hypothetical protein, partial [Vibrio navarrensis]|uniref:hypothetical protein n=1 Tax=Vibrio navarrensis TaxID=29495 RepID=UPI0030DA37A1